MLRYRCPTCTVCLWHMTWHNFPGPRDYAWPSHTGTPNRKCFKQLPASRNHPNLFSLSIKKDAAKWKNHLPRSQHPHIIHINPTDLPHWRYMTTLHSNQPFLSNHARLQELSAWGDGAAAEVEPVPCQFPEWGFFGKCSRCQTSSNIFLPDFSWIVFYGRWLILSIKSSSSYDSTGWKRVQIGCFLFFFQSSARPLTNNHPGAADPVKPSFVLAGWNLMQNDSAWKFGLVS